MTRRVLLVDDEPLIRQTLKEILEMYRYEVVPAASFAEAKLRLGAETFDVVITDLKMEHDRAGFDVARFAKEQSHPPVVVILTGFPDLGEDWKEHGADSLFTKPTNMPKLLESIEALLARPIVAASARTA